MLRGLLCLNGFSFVDDGMRHLLSNFLDGTSASRAAGVDLHDRLFSHLLVPSHAGATDDDADADQPAPPVAPSNPAYVPHNPITVLGRAALCAGALRHADLRPLLADLAVPALLLIPLVQVQATLRSFKPLLADASRWPMLQDVLSSGPFETREFKRIFNAYGDNIYYDSGSPEANAYLLGGATPSSSQTTQYLLRNEILKQIGELRDELKYQSGLAAEKRETDVADEALAAALAAFDEYLSLCPKKELEIAMSAVVPGTPQVARGGLERK